MISDFYLEVREPSTITLELGEFIQNNQHLTHWTPMAYDEPHWDACLEVPGDLLDQDPFLAWLRTQADYTGGILRMAPWTNYAWHTDYQRGCSLNLLLTDPLKSTCLFRHSPSDQIHGMYQLVPVAYRTTHYMCLNTQIEHSVFNWSEERFILTLHFLAELEEFTYRDLQKIVLRKR